MPSKADLEIENEELKAKLARIRRGKVAKERAESPNSDPWTYEEKVAFAQKIFLVLMVIFVVVFVIGGVIGWDKVMNRPKTQTVQVIQPNGQIVQMEMVLPTNTPVATTTPDGAMYVQQATRVPVYTPSSDVYGQAKTIKHDGEIGESGFWQPLTVSGYSYYEDNGRVIAEGECNEAISLIGMQEYFSEAIVVLNQPVLTSSPKITVNEKELLVDYAPGCTFAVVIP